MVTIQVSCQSVSDFYHTEGSEESVRPHNESNQSDSSSHQHPINSHAFRLSKYSCPVHLRKPLH